MLSIFDIFKIGIGPSSSHTVGPMVAAYRFADELAHKNLTQKVKRIQVDLYGSLALTGEGHGTMSAVLGGLEGQLPATVDTAKLASRYLAIKAGAGLLLQGETEVPFSFASDLLQHKDIFLPKHPNGMRFTAFGDGSDSLAKAEDRSRLAGLKSLEGNILLGKIYYSTGGGFIVADEDFGQEEEERPTPPYPMSCFEDLFNHCRHEKKTIAQIVMANEAFWLSEEAVVEKLLAIFAVMRDSVERGCCTEGVLPGGYNVKRRAPNLLRRATSLQAAGRGDMMVWPMLYAFAVSEENASGGRVVTAPTNGAAGVLPGALMYYYNFFPSASEEGIINFLLTAGAIGMFYKRNASISGAEVGCQGEVGVACSMAAGGYCAVTGGNLKQIEVAAEIAMEHNLGLTCDPVGGLVQIPCIERNGVAAERAVKCAQLSTLEDGNQRLVTLDQVVQVMYRTGMDLQKQYKETSLGGLASVIGHNLKDLRKK